MNSTEAAVSCVESFIAAFNALDHEALADTLNYPHVRLANNRFTTIDERDTYVRLSRSGEAQLLDQGWHHTEIESLDVIQEGEDKVHVAMRILRCKADGTTYLTFDTLWIVTRNNDHWGIQFRSSYLR